MIKHFARIGFAPLRIILLLLALPYVLIDMVIDATLARPAQTFNWRVYAFTFWIYWAAMAGHFVPKP